MTAFCIVVISHLTASLLNFQCEKKKKKNSKKERKPHVFLKVKVGSVRKSKLMSIRCGWFDLRANQKREKKSWIINWDGCAVEQWISINHKWQHLVRKKSEKANIFFWIEWHPLCWMFGYMFFWMTTRQNELRKERKTSIEMRSEWHAVWIDVGDNVNDAKPAK